MPEDVSTIAKQNEIRQKKLISISILLPGTGHCFPGLVNVGCLFCFDKHQFISPLLLHSGRNGFPSYQIIGTSVSHSTIYTFLTQLMNWLVMEHAKEKKKLIKPPFIFFKPLTGRFAFSVERVPDSALL